MACKTCDHTMHLITSTAGPKAVWWCPRCGTTKTRRIALAEGEMDEGEWHVPHWAASRDSDHQAIRAEQEQAIAEQRATIEEQAATIATLLEDERQVYEDNSGKESITT
jgi:hypothetical protein